MSVLISSVRIPGILNSRGTLKLKINSHEYPHRDRPIGQTKILTELKDLREHKELKQPNEPKQWRSQEFLSHGPFLS
jgi:hypothetical protein